MKEKVFSFAPSPEKFLLKTRVTIDRRQIMISEARALLGIIPAGRKNVAFPLRNIQSVTSEMRFYWGKIFLGLVLSGISLRLGGGAGFAAAGLFLLLALSGIGRSLVIGSGAGTYKLAIPWYSFGMLNGIKNCLNEGMCYESDKVDLFMHEERMAEVLSQAKRA